MPASPFPPVDFREAQVIAKTIAEQNAGKPMRRLTIFDSLKRSPESSTSRRLVTASAGFGLTQGSYKAEKISLTDRGKAVVEDDDPEAKISSVMGVKIFQEFFEQYKNSTLPSAQAASDFLVAKGIPQKSAKRCFGILVRSGEEVELIQEISGTKRVVSRDHAADTLRKQQGKKPQTDRKREEKADRGGEEDSRADDAGAGSYPEVHIDLQIHIPADASAEQIDRVFASMAKHLYGRSE